MLDFVGRHDRPAGAVAITNRGDSSLSRFVPFAAISDIKKPAGTRVPTGQNRR